MKQNSASALEELRIRHQFVGMLFALTIGQIAVYSYELTSIPDQGGRRFAALSHLVLCALLVIASWVGWSRSKAPGMLQRVQGVFEWLFIVLLLDVLLVVLYFIMVRKVEIGNSLLGGKYFGAPSAREETLWMILIFAAYAAWDTVAEVLVKFCHPCGPASDADLSKTRRRLPGLIAKHAFASFVCSCLAFVAYCTTATRVHSVGAVVVTDLALIDLVFLFRAMKPLDGVLRLRQKGRSRCRRFRVAMRANPEVAFVCPSLIIFVILLGVAHALERTVK